MRNRPIRACFDIDLERVWETTTLHIPPLAEGLVAALGGSGEATR
jgi:uncharacterized protein with HEPN domain